MTKTRTKREPISKRVRFEILKRDKFTCRYCGRKAPDVLLHIEHIHPIAKGGTNDYENLIAACQDCNGGKGARLLTDHTAITKSRDLLEQSQAEIEQLEDMIRWRKSIASKKAKQKEVVISSLEEIADTTFTAYGRKNILRAFDKYGFDICADHITGYLQDYDMRKERELKQYDFSKYIDFQQKKDTLEGKKAYLFGIIKNRAPQSSLVDMATWIKDDSRVTIEVIQTLIDSLQAYQPHRPYLGQHTFYEWWHESVREMFGYCCANHEEDEKA